MHGVRGIKRDYTANLEPEFFLLAPMFSVSVDKITKKKCKKSKNIDHPTFFRKLKNKKNKNYRLFNIFYFKLN